MNASLSLFARGWHVMCVCAEMASRKDPFFKRIQDKNRTKSQFQLQCPSLSTLQKEPCEWKSMWKMEREISLWARKWRERDFSRKMRQLIFYIYSSGNLSFVIRAYTYMYTENHVCSWNIVDVRLYFTISFEALHLYVCVCVRAVFYRVPFKSTMLFHSHLPFIIFRALFINQHYIP